MPEKQTNLAWDTLLAPLRTRGADGGPGMDGPMHRRLARLLREAVRDRRIPAGAALPPSRLLAAELGCSRWVVTEAYGQLVAEGYLEARTGSATRVRGFPPPPPLVPGRPAPRPPAAAGPLLDLIPGLPDLRAFPRRGWADAVHRALSAASDAELGSRPPAGHPRLRGVLAEYLRRVRGAEAAAADVVVCRGIADGIGLVCAALRESGRRQIAVEEPCWAQVRQAANGAGLECVPVSVDERGLRVEELYAYPGLRAVAVSPAHQFPTGAVMAPDRRAALLRWAESADALVLEDDYDAEFRYDRDPVGVLQGVAPARVVLLGSVSKTLSPALGLGWMVAPPDWAARVLARRTPAAAPALPDQLALAGFMQSGAYDRQLRAVRRHYRARRAALIAALSQELPGVRVTGADAGLHLVARLDGPGGAAWGTQVAGAAARLGLRLSPLDFHYHGPSPDGRALVLGYGNLPDHAVGQAAALVRAAVEAVAPS
jgi:GntR family transcriptional regulator / MocR family aminotransferase